MSRKMRRAEKILDQATIHQILINEDYGVLGTVGDDGYPYTVPLNYVYDSNAIYFHCALEGHKLENIQFNSKVSFTVVEKHEVLPAKFSTNYRSVILFGHANLVEGHEKRAALEKLIEKYSPDYLAEGPAYIDRFYSKTGVVKIEIDRMTGKGNKE